MLIQQRVISNHNFLSKNLHPILQRIFRARGILSEAELSHELKDLLPFEHLKNIDKASARLEQALRNNECILIVGDFDADGATSTALAISSLKKMGAKKLHFLVPNRFEFGYGLTPGLVEVAKELNPQLIITVDNGIASSEGVIAANQSGIDVLVTDHHLAPEVLPPAFAIVNPNQPGCDFASKAISGVGVIFYVMLALRRQLINNNWFNEQGIEAPNMAQFLDLVALGTVADVVPLDKNNRILIKQGLNRIRQGNCRIGLKALIKVANRDIERIWESDLGFAIAPRINAAGRLDDMSLGIECLLADNWETANNIALQLDELNVERRRIEVEMKDHALNILNDLSLKTSTNNPLPIALCLMDESWHQGVIGILAGRLKEKFHRPVIVFAKVSDSELKGSARSIPGLNIRDLLADIHRDNPSLIIKFGGHAMAAGLSISPENYSLFKEKLVTEVSKHMDVSQCEGIIFSDGPLMMNDLNLELALAIQMAGPWGQQFPEPLFDNVFQLLDQRIVGERHLKLILQHEAGGEPIDAILFNIDLNTWPNYHARSVHAAYKLDINDYLGKKKVQLLIQSMTMIAAH